jgi:hypothetical protein
MYKGAIILESLDDIKVIKDFTTLNVTVANDPNPSDRWHIHDVEATRDQLQLLSRVMKPDRYYAHFWNKNRDIVVVYRDKIFEFNFDDKKSWEPAIKYGLSVGIPREQLDFPIQE